MSEEIEVVEGEATITSDSFDDERAGYESQIKELAKQIEQFQKKTEELEQKNADYEKELKDRDFISTLSEFKIKPAYLRKFVTLLEGDHTEKAIRKLIQEVPEWSEHPSALILTRKHTPLNPGGNRW